MRTFTNLLIILIYLVITIPNLSAQNDNEIKTISGSDHKNGGYGGFSIGYTRMNYNFNGFIFGGKGAWIINHSFGIGGAFYGYAHFKNYDFEYITGRAGGYGGLLLEPVFWGKHPVNISVPLIIGGGSYTAFTSDNYIIDSYFIFVPGIELQFNVTKHYRMALGFDYRLTSKIESSLLDPENEIIAPEAPGGFSVHLVFKFGKF
jgi:hypothetical protein